MFPKYGLYGNHMIQRFAKLHEAVVFLNFILIVGPYRLGPHSISGEASQASFSNLITFFVLFDFVCKVILLTVMCEIWPST